MGELIGFGATEHARKIARERAERIAAAQAFEPDWRSKYPSRPEARRATILAASTCVACERKFAHGTKLPDDRLCRDCRARSSQAQAPAPTLFDDPGLDS